MTKPQEQASAKAKTRKTAGRASRRGGPRLRVLPVTILVASLMLSMKVAGMWNGLDAVEPANAAEGDTTPAQAAKATPQDAADGAETAAAADNATGTGNGATAERAGDRALEDDDVFQAPRQEAVSQRDYAARVDLGSLSRGEILVLQKLADRRRDLDQREKALDEREQLVAAMEKRVDAKLAELKQIQGRLEELAGQYSEREEKEYQRLVKIYEAMEPKDAARIFEELDPPVLLRVISRMKERKTAPILAEMNPKTARYVTTHMAERRQLPALGN